jgi:hypothetical protein
MSPIALLGLAAVWIAGWTLSAAIFGRRPRRDGDFAFLLGSGYLLGAMLAGTLLWIQGEVAVNKAIWSAGGGLILITAGSLLLSWQMARRFPAAALRPQHAPRDAFPVQSRRFMQGLLLLAFLAILIQSVTLPILMWDAWNAWLAKAKAWYFVGTFLPMLGVDQWLTSPVGEARAVVAPGYPEALPRLVTALNWLDGRWLDSTAAAPWALLWLAGGLLMLGALKRRGAPSGLAWCAVTALLTLPLVLAHSALAGYMDLWLAFAVLLAVVCGDAWLRDRRSASLAGFLLGVLLLPTLKFEGAVYAVLLLVAFALWCLPGRLRWTVMLVGLIGGLIAWWGIGVSFTLPGVGLLELNREVIRLPMLGSYDLSWQPVGRTVAQSMFLLPNWSLLWYLLPVFVVLRLRRRDGHAAVEAFALLALAFHVLLFFFTHASAWAEDLTSLNRLLLHVAPVWVWLYATCFIPPPRPRGRYA